MLFGGEHTGWRSAVIYTFVEQAAATSRTPLSGSRQELPKQPAQPLDHSGHRIHTMTAMNAVMANTYERCFGLRLHL